MSLSTLKQLSKEGLNGARVFVRIALDGSNPAAPPLDASSIEPFLPTIMYLLQARARVIVATDLGIPGGAHDESFNLERLAVVLETVLGIAVHKLSTAVGTEALRAVIAMRPGELVLLENLGLYGEERLNDPAFAQQLAALAQIYCNDAFELAHVAMASTVGITRYMPVSVAGFDMGRQIMVIESIAQHPEPPFLAILGGNRLAETLLPTERLFRKVDEMFVAGALSLTFLKAQGYQCGAFQPEEDSLRLVEEFVKTNGSSLKLVLPDDFVCIHEHDLPKLAENGSGAARAHVKVVPATGLLPSDLPLDIGPMTILRVGTLLERCRTLFWHGPLGVSEIEAFSTGTRDVAHRIVAKRSTRFQSLICGGSLVRTIRNSDVPVEDIGEITTAGESALEMFTGDPLPAVEALRSKAGPQLATTLRRTIVIPLEAEDGSLRVLRTLSRTLELTGSNIHLLLPHKTPLLSAIKSTLLPGKREKERQWLSDAERIFALADAILSRSGATVGARLTVDGDAASRIVEYSRTIGADLIAMGCHGLTRTQRLVFHESGQAVVDRARCPVLLLRLPDHENGPDRETPRKTVAIEVNK